MKCFLIVGLGNPGDKYAHNRHNVGFMAVDFLYEQLSSLLHSSPSAWSEKFHSRIATVLIGDTKTILLKPLTYMNNSGAAVSEVMRFYKIPLSNLTVIHDDLDLAVGKIRTKIGGGSGGHNGLKSIDQHLGTDYIRIRIGIGHPGDKELVNPHVLSNFTGQELEAIAPAVQRVTESISCLTNDGFEEFKDKIRK